MESFIPISYREKDIIEGGIYHITQHASFNNLLFLEKKDYLSFISFLKMCQKRFQPEIFGFCLMPNHLHILLQIKKPNLSEAMHSLFTNYGMAFNNKYKRKGHVFSGVYRASMCMDETHLLASSLYIHFNPQKAGLLDDCTKYRWSSIRLFTYDGLDFKSFINRDFILELISNNKKNAVNGYKKLLENAKAKKYKDVEEDARAPYRFAVDMFPSIMNCVETKINSQFLSKESELQHRIEKIRLQKKYILTPGIKSELIDLINELKQRSYNLLEIAKLLHISRKTLYKLLTGAGNK